MRLIAATLLLLAASAANTNAAAPMTATANMTSTKPKSAPVVRTAASLQCSKDADAKNIHGKPRKAFMSSCKKAASK